MCLLYNEQTKVRGYLWILLYKIIMVYIETHLGFDTFVRRATNKIHVIKNHVKNKNNIPTSRNKKWEKKIKKDRKQKKCLPRFGGYYDMGARIFHGLETMFFLLAKNARLVHKWPFISSCSYYNLHFLDFLSLKIDLLAHDFGHMLCHNVINKVIWQNPLNFLLNRFWTKFCSITLQKNSNLDTCAKHHNEFFYHI